MERFRQWTFFGMRAGRVAAAVAWLLILPGLRADERQDAPADAVLVDGIAAHVNERTITIGDVMSMIAPVRRELMRTYRGEELRRRSQEAFENALDTLIARRLIVDAYEAQDRFEIPDWVVEQRVTEIITEMFDGDRAALMAQLAKDNLTYDHWRESLNEHIIVSYMRRLYVEDKVAVSPAAVLREYEENIDDYREPAEIKLRMIVLSKGPSEETAAAKREMARDLRGKLIAGADFGQMAKEVSEGMHAATGGDWGWVRPSILRPELAAAVRELPTAEVSPLVETKDDIYLVKVEARRDEKVESFQRVEDTIRRKLERQESERLYAIWVARLREKAFVKVLAVDPFAESADS